MIRQQPEVSGPRDGLNSRSPDGDVQIRETSATSGTPVRDAMNTVWIIEDNEGYRQSLVRVVSQSDVARSGRDFASCEDALDALRQDPPPDVILLDIQLPGMSGVEGVREFKAAAPKAEIVMLTMISHHTTVFQALCAGATGYLVKTASPEMIRQSISEVLDGGAPMSPQVARSVIRLFSQHAPKNPDYGLTPREKEVLEHLVKGEAKKEIAWNIKISYHTVDKHVRSIYEKLHVHSLSAAVAKAIQEKLF